MGNNYKLLVLIFLFFVAKSFFHISLPMIAVKQGMGDAHVRIMMAVRDIIHQYGVWQPLHFYLLNIIYKIFKDIYFAPRIFAVIQNLLISLILFFLTKKQSKNLLASYLTLLLFIIIPYFSIYTTFPITELLFNIFLLTGLLFFMEDGHYFWLSLSFFNLAHMIRFESWYLYLILFFL